MKYLYIILSLILTGFSVSSQTYNPLRIKEVTSDSVVIISDSLSIVPGTVVISDPKGQKVADSYFSIDYLRGEITLKPGLERPVRISYRVYPFAFYKPNLHKDMSLIGKAPDSSQNKYIYNPENNNTASSFTTDELVRRGSISRSLTIGNNQNAVMNSTLNLQLSGKLSNDLNISAAVSDNNVPLQPDGTTTQIQEFDKVNFRVYNNKFSVLAGDFELNRNSGTFLKMNRKVRGGIFSLTLPDKEKTKTVFSSQFAGAVSKGKYNRITITAIEGNQGPYRLKGVNNETFVIIIAGSERIWVDGRLMERGLDKDYIIDYNMAELTFTPRMPVTKDKRIIAEFEYSEQSYARFAIFSASDWKGEKHEAWLNIFHEQDSKNQPIQQDLTDPEKDVMSHAGDNVLLASVPGFFEDTVFRNDAVFYKMTDTLVTGITYDSVLVYSIIPDSAIYRASFVFAGVNKGNYDQIQSSANGKVYKWVAPENGVPQGSYEPVRYLVMPKSKTVLTSGGNFRINEKTEVEIEGGLSYNDRNKFSGIDDADNAGFTFQAAIKRSVLPKDTSGFKAGFSAFTRFTQARFDAVDRFRASEYERDWNLPSTGSADEIVAGADLNMIIRNRLTFMVGGDGLKYGNGFTGLREKTSASFRYKGFRWNFTGSNLNTQESLRNTSFMRGNSDISQKAGPMLIGIEGMAEDNQWKKPDSDSLITGTKRFFQFSPFIMMSDTGSYPVKAGVIFRDDFIPDSGVMSYESRARDWFINGGVRKNPNNTMNLQLTYRELYQFDTMPLQTNITGRAEQMFRTKKQSLTIQTFYETGSGMELKHEFAYVEVSPGQGVFQWTDYNGNGIKELDEFEVAAFSDQATYVRLYTPGTDYVKVFTNKVSQNIGLYPDRIWTQSTGVLKILSKFSNVLAYSFDNKTSSENWEEKINPYGTGTSDSMLVSFIRNIRNVLSFNRTHQVFGADYQIQSLDSRQLLLNGFDTRSIFTHSLKTRCNFNRFFSLLADFSLGKKDFTSEYFSAKNYRIELRSVTGTLSYQPNSSSRLSMIPRYSIKDNTGGTEKAEITELSLEFQRSVTEGGNILVKITANDIKYNGVAASSVSYEMLEGLAAGTNYLWTAQIIKSLNKSLQMSLNYTGRKTETSKIVHTGTVEFRAFF